MDAMLSGDAFFISIRHRFHLKLMHDTWGSVFYHPDMINAEANATRTLTLVLPESDWKALRAAEPDALGWLRAQIEQRLASPGAPWSSRSNAEPATRAASWRGNEDEY
jgi:hypothetical protein